MLWRSRRWVAWRHYWCRLAFITALSICNWAVSLVEQYYYGAAIQAQELHPEPVFILGHARTGTTHLHNILAHDGRFAYATTFQAGFPSTFMLLQRFSWFLSFFIDETRPMDAMPLSFTTPAEDEIAVNVLTGGVSPYAAVTFMPRYRELLPYCTFEGCSQADIDAWCRSFLWFLRKVTLAAGGGRGGRPLLIKSPVHMGRVPLLLRLFPRAKFIFIHRDPLEVFQSNAHMADTYFWYCYVCRVTDEQVTDYILDQHRLLYDAYLEERKAIPSGSLAECSFAELDADPVATLRRIYQKLSWTDEFGAAVPAIRAYCSQLEGFRKNDHASLSVGMRARLERECGGVLAALGYRRQ